jgi:hypothetical protein
VLSACGNPFAPPRPPTAAEILDKPAHSNLKDAHFVVSASIPLSASAGTVTASGDGLLVFKPAQAVHMTLQTNFAGQTATLEEISIGGKDYSRVSGQSKWTVKASTSSPGDFSGTDAKYVGEEVLPQGKAWHVKAKTKDTGDPFDAWVRESDGYPLKFSGSSATTQLTFSFDRFNTGGTVTAPPASEVVQG